MSEKRERGQAPTPNPDPPPMAGVGGFFSPLIEQAKKMDAANLSFMHQTTVGAEPDFEKGAGTAEDDGGPRKYQYTEG